jgi:multiple sugar transport system permease protein
VALQHVVPQRARSLPDAAELLPPRLDFDNYRAVLNSSVPFLQIYANSVEVAVLVTIGQLVTCTLAAFAFAPLNFPGRDTLFFIMIAGLLFPAQVTIIPIYLGFGEVGLLNRPIGLALKYLTSSFGVFLVRQFMRSQPRALEEAALMDGAGYLKIFFRISLPQLRPALASLGIITFTQTWNYYFQARVLLEPQDAMTLPIAMDVLRGVELSTSVRRARAAFNRSKSRPGDRTRPLARLSCERAIHLLCACALPGGGTHILLRRPLRNRLPRRRRLRACLFLLRLHDALSQRTKVIIDATGGPVPADK